MKDNLLACINIDNYTIESFYEYCADCKPFLIKDYSKKEFIEKYRKSIQYQTWIYFMFAIAYEAITDFINKRYFSTTSKLMKILYDYGYWWGEMNKCELKEFDNFEEIRDTILNHYDELEIKVYDDRIEIIGIHNDAKDYLVITPFYWNKLTVKQLRKCVIDNHLKELVLNDWEVTYKRAKKQELINTCESNFNCLENFNFLKEKKNH